MLNNYNLPVSCCIPPLVVEDGRTVAAPVDPAAP